MAPRLGLPNTQHPFGYLPALAWVCTRWLKVVPDWAVRDMGPVRRVKEILRHNTWALGPVPRKGMLLTGKSTLHSRADCKPELPLETTRGVYGGAHLFLNLMTWRTTSLPTVSIFHLKRKKEKVYWVKCSKSAWFGETSKYIYSSDIQTGMPCSVKKSSKLPSLNAWFVLSFHPHNRPVGFYIYRWGIQSSERLTKEQGAQLVP